MSVFALTWSICFCGTIAWLVWDLVLGHGRAKKTNERVAVGEGVRLVLVRPCAGADAGLALALRSRPASSTPVDTRIAVVSEDDAAFGVASLASHARVVVTHAVGPNFKADQIARALAGEAFDVVVVADGDVDLSGFDLDAFVAPLQAATVGAVWAVPVELAPRTFGDLASAAVLGASLHAFTLLRALDRSGMVGKLAAYRADALDAIGGFDAFRSCLGEDMEMARRLRERGFTIASSRAIAHCRARGISFAAAVERYARWVSVIRSQRPQLLASYPLFFLCTWSIMIVSSFGSRTHPRLTAITIALAWVARVAAGATARFAAGLPVFHRLSRDVLLADFLLACAFFRALTTTRVVWRGHAFSIAGRGVMREVTHTR